MTTLLVDSNNLLIRAVRATERVPLSADGVPTAALHVYINMLSRHVREERPDRLVVCWDGGRSAYRTGLYPAYKAGRSERPLEERGPFAQAKEFLTLAGLHHVERPGWEADDLIAAYWRSLRPLDDPVVIVSGDKDLLQLLGPGVEQVRPTRSEDPVDRWTAQRVEREMGCRPADLAKVMALTGDPGDGVPGVRGVGPKRAAKMLADHGWDLGALVYTKVAEHDWSADVGQGVLLSQRLVDLRDLPYHAHGLVLGQPPRLAPTAAGDALFPALLAFLDRYQLDQTRSRLLSRQLWGGALARSAS